MKGPENALDRVVPGEGVDITAFARQFGKFGQYAYHYTAAKLKMDPLFPTVYELMRGRDLPLLDLGCGMGVNAFYLRQRGYTAPILGIDYDARKIRDARAVARAYTQVEFREGDAREIPADFAGDVVILDILQFFTAEEQRGILEKSARAAKLAGGQVIIRSTIRDDSQRFRAGRMGDALAKLTRWMKDAPTAYPTLESASAPFREAGFTVETRPCWGKTVFNNYLLLFTLPN